MDVINLESYICTAIEINALTIYKLTDPRVGHDNSNYEYDLHQAVP